MNSHKAAGTRQRARGKWHEVSGKRQQSSGDRHEVDGAAAVRAASVAMLASSEAEREPAGSSDLEPFALPIVLVRASTPLYDFSELDMINGWSLHVYVQQPQEQLASQLRKNQESKSEANRETAETRNDASNSLTSASEVKDEEKKNENSS